MAASIGTTTTAAKLLKNYWHNFFLDNLYQNTLWTGLTKSTKVPAGSGKTVWWVGLNKVSPAGASLSEGADPDSRSSNARRISGVLAEYGNLIKDSRLFMDTSIEGTRAAILKDLAQDAALQMDNLLLTKALAGGTAIYQGGALHRSSIVSASTATIRDIRRAVNLLEKSSVPRWSDGFYVGFVHPDVAFDLQSDSAWTDIVKYRDTVKYDIPGEIGRLWGVRFVSAPNISLLVNSGSANVDIYRTLIFGPEFLGQSELGALEIVINEPGKTSELNMFNTYGYRFVMATEVLSNSRAVRLESSASLGTD